MVGLLGQFLLQPHPLADIAGVQDDAANLAVAAQVGHVRLEVAPLAEAVLHPEHELVGPPGRVGRTHDRAVVGVQEADETAPQDGVLVTRRPWR